MNTTSSLRTFITLAPAAETTGAFAVRVMAALGGRKTAEGRNFSAVVGLSAPAGEEPRCSAMTRKVIAAASAFGVIVG